MAAKKIQVAILEDHASVVEGYLYRLNAEPKIKVVKWVRCGEELESLLSKRHIDVLLLDVQVPISGTNTNHYPVVHAIPRLIEKYPELNILVISMHTGAALIESLVDAGASGYIFKDDDESFQSIAKIVLMIAKGDVHFSEAAAQKLRQIKSGETGRILSPRQLEALTMCAADPDMSTAKLALCLKIKGSTLRTLLSLAYVRLGVRTRAAAIARAQKLGLIPDSDTFLE